MGWIIGMGTARDARLTDKSGPEKFEKVIILTDKPGPEIFENVIILNNKSGPEILEKTLFNQ